jgi:hypothetical protein
MRKFTLPAFLVYIGGFFPALNARRSLVMVGAMALAAGTAMRGNPPTVASVQVTQHAPNVVRVEFLSVNGVASNNPDYWGLIYGADYINLSALTSPSLFLGTLQSITPNLRLESFGLDEGGNPQVGTQYATEVWDLAVYIGPLGSPPVYGPSGYIQVGGTNGVDASLLSGAWKDWGGAANGTATNLPQVTMGSLFATDVSSMNIVLGPANISDPVLLVNAYTEAGSFGRWSGYIDFTFASSTGSGVPDASRTALLLAPGTLLLLGLAGRSRRRA